MNIWWVAGLPPGSIREQGLPCWRIEVKGCDAKLNECHTVRQYCAIVSGLVLLSATERYKFLKPVSFETNTNWHGPSQNINAMRTIRYEGGLGQLSFWRPAYYFHVSVARAPTNPCGCQSGWLWLQFCTSEQDISHLFPPPPQLPQFLFIIVLQYWTVGFSPFTVSNWFEIFKEMWQL